MTGESIAPEEFFAQAKPQWRISYGIAHSIKVRVGAVDRGNSIAFATEIETGRRTMLQLCNGMLKDAGRGCFADICVICRY